jgi:hypothetical protein
MPYYRPEILRYLMVYVIDIIIVMSCLFALVDSGGLDRVSFSMVNLVPRDRLLRRGAVRSRYMKAYVMSV